MAHSCVSFPAARRDRREGQDSKAAGKPNPRNKPVRITGLESDDDAVDWPSVDRFLGEKGRKVLPPPPP